MCAGVFETPPSPDGRAVAIGALLADPSSRKRRFFIVYWGKSTTGGMPLPWQRPGASGVFLGPDATGKAGDICHAAEQRRLRSIF